MVAKLVIVAICIVVVSVGGLAGYESLANTNSSETTSVNSSSITIAQSTSTTVATINSLSAFPMNNTITLPTSGQGDVYFNVSSQTVATFYFEAIPNSTMPMTYGIFPNDPAFPFANVTLANGFSAVYPNGQVLNETSHGIFVVQIHTTNTPIGAYPLYLFVFMQVPGGNGQGMETEFTVNVVSN